VTPRTRALTGAACVAAGIGIWLLAPTGGDLSAETDMGRVLQAPAVVEPGEAPAELVDLAFLHHSVGEHLLASPGAEGGRDGAFPTHPNGGGLAALLAANNYRLHEATYGSRLGEHTDLFHWLPKFRTRMDDILALAHQDERLPEGHRNRVVLFKSCYPNNEFVGPGSGDGRPDGPELTEANGRATLRALLPEFAKRPDVLFVYLTAPPLAPHTWREPRWKRLAKQVLGRPTHDAEFRESAAMARRFNTWVVSSDGWLKGYAAGNVAVFDLYDVLTGHGASDFLLYPSGDGTDSHPSHEGHAKVAPALVSFLNRSVKPFVPATAPSAPPTQ